MSGKIYKINKSNNFYPKTKYVHAYYEKEPSEPKPPQQGLTPSYTEILKNPLTINFEKSDFDQIYTYFKAVEKGLKLELESISEKNALIKSNDISKLLKILEDFGEFLLMKNMKLSAEKQIDKRILFIFKQDIEKRMKIDVLNDLAELLDGKMTFMNKIIMKLAEMCPDLNNSELAVVNHERKIMASFLHFMGEALEFKEKHENKGKIKSTERITMNYFRAINIYPFEGKFFMSFAILAQLNNDNLSSIYWGMKAFMAEIPLDVKEYLQEFFEKAKKNYESVMKEKTDYSQINPKDLLRLFLMAFLRYLYIFFTKISFEKIGEVSGFMMDFLGKYIAYLKSESAIDKTKEANILSYIIQMIIFSLFFSIEGFDMGDKNPEKKLQKTVEQMENNVISRECLQYSFCLLYQIYSLLLNDDCEAYLNLLLPTLYYLATYKNVQRFFFEKFPKFKQLLIKIADALKKKLPFQLVEQIKSMNSEKEEEKKEESDVLEEGKAEETTESFHEILMNHLLPTDKSLVGFIPLKKYFVEHKKAYNIYTKENQALLKFYLALDLLNKIGCLQDSIDQTPKELAIKMELETALLEDFKNLDLSHLRAEDLKDKSKTMILIDGQNVALRHKEDQFSSKALKMVVDYWLKKGYLILILLPDICFSKEIVSKKKEIAKQTKGKNSIKNLPDDIEILLDLKKRGFATGIPSGTYDDSYIIEYAKKKNAYILTNDRYRDHIENYSKNDPRAREDLRAWIKDHCIKFSFF